MTTSHFALNSLRWILYPDLQTTRKYKTTLEDDESLFYALKMHTLMYRRLHIKSFGRTRPRFNNKYCGSAFLFFLLVLSVSIRFLRDYTLLHFYFSWLVEICIKDRRGADGRAERSNSGVLRACCGSERCWVNRAPHWRPVPWVIPTPRRSERQTRRHRSEIGQMLNFITYFIFIHTLRSVKVRYFSILTFSCAVWLAREYVCNHM